jgi:hypothetical protein
MAAIYVPQEGPTGAEITQKDCRVQAYVDGERHDSGAA